MARILVVDDDRLIRSCITEALENSGHIVQVAEDGVSGLAAFQAGSFDLVISDMLMPNSDGVELISALQRNYPHLPIIAMSGAPDSAQFLFLASYFGAGKTLTKPFLPEELFAAVDNALKLSK